MGRDMRGYRRTPEEKESSRRILRGTAAAVIAVFAVMTVYICVYAARSGRTFFDNDYNTRPQMLLSQNRRGSIYAADGQVLAETVTGADGSDIRSYPFGALFAHAVGYDVYGASGIEDAAEYDLVRSDLPLTRKAEYDRAGQKYPGNNVITTLDPALQRAASDALGIYRGAIIVTDPRDGRILAMVSRPDYDPNDMRENWEEYRTQSDTAVLLNRATQGLYPPGSTFKIVDAAEYLAEHGASADGYSFRCSGSITLEGGTIRCYHGQAHGALDLRGSFAQSCNCSFANMGMGLDRAAFGRLLDDLLFNRELPFDMPHSRSRAAAGADTDAADIVQLSIGQGGTGITPLHLNMITSAAANGGILMRPYMIDRVETAEGSLIRETTPEAYGRILSEDVAAGLRSLMEAVVEEGTATKLKGFGYTAAGKTGSAEFDESDPTQSHAWFTGYAPAEDPQVCVTIILEGAGSGGGYAVPMARDIFDCFFKK